MAIVKLSVSERRRTSAFLTCLVLAVLAWIFTTLSNPYNFIVKEVLNFKNAPQKRAFHSLQSDTVNVTVKGSGWEMLFSKFNTENKLISIDLRTLDVKNYIVLSSQLKQINDKKELKNEIIDFNPDTLYFDFSDRSIKRVPVQLVTSVRYQRQFAQSDNILIKPAYVTITGPSNRLEHIKTWPTDSLKISDVNETVTSRINLQPVKEGNMSIYPKSVMVTIPVDEFTEKTIEVPVKLVNNRNYYNVKVFPQKVKVTFITSLNKYPLTDEDSFKAEANLDVWSHSGYNVLPVRLIKSPPFCKIVRIEPQNIDFIIKK